VDQYGKPRVFEGFSVYEAQQLEKSGAVVSMVVPGNSKDTITAWLMPDGTAEIEKRSNCVSTSHNECPVAPSVTVSTVWNHVGQTMTIGDCPNAFSANLNPESGIFYHGLAQVGRIISFVDTDKRTVARWMGQEAKPDTIKASCNQLSWGLIPAN
jgi:hypothetical protein